MQVKKQQLELDMEQQTGSKSGKEYVKAVCYHPPYLTYNLSFVISGLPVKNLLRRQIRMLLHPHISGTIGKIDK